VTDKNDKASTAVSTAFLPLSSYLNWLQDIPHHPLFLRFVAFFTFSSSLPSSSNSTACTFLAFFVGLPSDLPGCTTGGGAITSEK
jgi:hypothetical protein